MRTFKPEEEKEICTLYQKEGYSLTLIRQKYHCRIEAIKAVLAKYNVKIKKQGQSKNRLVNENFFEAIDSEEKAYFLGLIFTDGSITNDNKRSPMFRLQLKISDVEILEKLRQCLNIHSQLIYDKRAGKECVTLCLRNKKIANDLAKYGIVQNKTYITKHLPKIPEIYEKDFLRGLLDGDGSIYQETTSKKYRIDFCSYHQSICEEFRNLCNKYIKNINKNTIANYGTAYHIRFNIQEDVKQLATALYKDSNYYLARKYALAEKLFIEDKSEEDIVYSDH